MKDIEYYLNGSNFKDFGVYVSGSKGIIDRLKRKKPLTAFWDNYNGEVVDLRVVRYEPREIELVCFLEAMGANDFITKMNSFLSIFDSPGTQRLQIDVIVNKPLVYEVYSYDSVAINKSWDNDYMVGTFTIKLIEPSPVKMVLKGIGATNITMQCKSLLTIYWGDGTKTSDLSGSINVSHNTTGYIVIAGNIDDITNLTTNGTIIWNKLL